MHLESNRNGHADIESLKPKSLLLPPSVPDRYNQDIPEEKSVMYREYIKEVILSECPWHDKSEIKTWYPLVPAYSLGSAAHENSFHIDGVLKITTKFDG